MASRGRALVAMLARYMLSSCIRPYVRLSQVRVLERWLNLGSQKQRHTIAHGLSFTDAKNVGKIPTGSPQRGRQIEVGYV